MTRARDVANLIGSGNYSSTTFTATAGQTAFTIAHTQGFVQVFMNGLLLDETVDWTSDGSAVTLTSGAAAGDEIEVVAYNTFSVGDALNQAAADTRYVNASGDTMSGDLIVNNQVTMTHDNSGTDAYINLFLSNPNTSSGIRMTGSGNVAYELQSQNDGNFALYDRTNSGYRIKVDSSGRVTMPYQPSFRAYKTNGNVNTSSVVVLNNVVLNIGSSYSNSTGRFTAPIAGRYIFNVQGICGINAGTTVNGDLRLRVNGTFQHRGHFNHSDRWENVGYSTVVELSASDYVDVYFEPSAGSPELYGADKYTSFSGYLLG